MNQKVRAVCWTGPEGKVVTGSRDNTAKLWEAQGADLFVCENTFEGHSRYIMSVAYAGPTAAHPAGAESCWNMLYVYVFSLRGISVACE